MSTNCGTNQTSSAFLRAPPDLMEFDPNHLSPSGQTSPRCNRVPSLQSLHSHYSSLTLSRLSDSPRVSMPSTPRKASPESTSLSHVRYSTPLRLSNVSTATAANVMNTPRASQNESSVSGSNNTHRPESFGSILSLEPTPRLERFDLVLGASPSWSKCDSDLAVDAADVPRFGSPSNFFMSEIGGSASHTSPYLVKSESELREEDIGDNEHRAS